MPPILSLARLSLAALACCALVAPLRAQARMGRDSENPADRDEDGQRAKLPGLPQGMTVATIRDGDALFHGKGGCVTCHGPEATGMPNAGSSLTSGLHFIPYTWGAIDSLIKAGIPEPITRSSIAMPARGAASNLSDDESRRIAAYVWAISQVRGEPWPGGHQTHGTQTAAAPKPNSRTPSGARR
jgi:mono/diheme cytochrome c family protein